MLFLYVFLNYSGLKSFATWEIGNKLFKSSLFTLPQKLTRSKDKFSRITLGQINLQPEKFVTSLTLLLGYIFFIKLLYLN